MREMLVSLYHNICDKYDVLTNITDMDVENIFAAIFNTTYLVEP